MLLSIVIVSWNVCDLLRNCLRSVSDDVGDLAVEIIVVDSGSTDQSVEMVQTEFPEVTLLAQTENVGFPRGNNIGMAAATGDYILLLNPDTEVIGDALTVMVDYMVQHPQVGVIGPQLLNTDGTHQSSRRRFPTLTTAHFESTWLQPYAPKRVLEAYYVWDLPNSQTASVDWVSGACMLTRRQIMSQVGGMDAGYFMYSEELDWCRRIKDVGWDIVYLPSALITHHAGKSSEQAVTHRHINFNRAKLRYFRKYHGYPSYLVLRLFLLRSYWLQLCTEGAKWLVGQKRDLRKQRIGVYWQVIKSGLTAAGYEKI